MCLLTTPVVNLICTYFLKKTIKIIFFGTAPQMTNTKESCKKDNYRINVTFGT